MIKPIIMLILIMGFGSCALGIGSINEQAVFAQEQLTQQSSTSDKSAIYKTIDKHQDRLWNEALRIWSWAEPGYQETKSSELLAKLLEENQFRLKRNVAGIPTAFTAEYGSGEPVIGLLGEYDALPGLSQDPLPYRSAKDVSAYGHACGHHLFGVGSAGAAIAIAEEIKQGKIKGTIRFYGCPAEEGGASKVFMVQAGLFDDCDTVLHWHPSNRNAAGARSSLARIAVKFRFQGSAAHAAGAPEEGRSALDAVALTNHGAELLREHIPETARIHYVITSGGAAPNIVPEFAEVYYYVRHSQAKVVQKLYDRLLLCAQAGALATQTKLHIDFQGGVLNILPNVALSDTLYENLDALNDLKYNKEEQLFAVKIQETLVRKPSISTIAEVYDVTGTVGKGSTDVGDVSWVVPTAGFNTACWVPGTAAHSWQATACGGTTLGRKGMLLATKTLAATVWDLYSKPEILDAAKQEFKQRTAKERYKTLMLPDQKPDLDYRK